MTEPLLGGRCLWCRARRGVLVIYQCRRTWRGEWVVSGSGRCVDRDACRARVRRRAQTQRRASQRRSGVFVLEEPRAPNAPRGWCRWCGARLLRGDGRLDKRRNYCYPDREGRDCVASWNHSRTYQPRTAVRFRAGKLGDVLACVDCGLVVEERRNGHWVELWREHATYDEKSWRWVVDPAHPGWEADHEVPLEDGGEHSLENLRCRCVPCHRAKTARESAARAEIRRLGGRAAA